MKFIKLQYKDVIKKILLTKEELTWDHLCEIIMSSFSFPDKEKIILKYMVFFLYLKKIQKKLCLLICICKGFRKRGNFSHK